MRGFPPSSSQQPHQQPSSRSRRQHSRRLTDEDDLPVAGSSLRGAQAHAVVMMDAPDSLGETRGGAPTVTTVGGLKRSPGREASATSRARPSRTFSVPFATSTGSRPTSPLRPPSNRGSVFGNLGTSASGAFNSTLGRKRSSDPVRSAQSPNTATSTALLFPTTEWIRTALGMDGRADRGSGGGTAVVGGGRGSGAGQTIAPAAASAAAQSTPPSTATPSPPPAATRDTAMRLHEQRVQAALRSQEEMRDFGVILRRLEEEGAQVLREQRRRRQDRHARLRGSIDGGRPRRHRRSGRDRAAAAAAAITNTAITGEPQRRLSGGSESSRGAEDDGDDDFSDYTDEEEEAMGRTGDEGSGDSSNAAALAGGRGGGRGQSSKAAAEVHGAANMSRVALLKLRDRTAREWVVLQRRRLEQRRGGPAALHRHMQASQLRLQATRTGGVAERRCTSDGVPMLMEAPSGNTAGYSGLPPLDDGGPSLHPVTGSSLTISWGEQGVSAGPVAGHSVSREEEPEQLEGTLEPRLLQTDGDDSAMIVAAADVARTPVSPHAGATCASPLSAGRSSSSGDTAAHTSLGHRQSKSQRGNSSDALSASTPTIVNVATPLTEDVGTHNALACTTNGFAATMVSPISEDERLRRELQRLLFQANECTLYGLDQCLNSRARTKAVVTTSTKAQRQQAQRGKGAAWTPARQSQTALSSSRNAAKHSGSPETPSHASEASRTAASTSAVPSTSQHVAAAAAAGGLLADARSTSLPRPLHRQLTHYYSPMGGSVSRGSASMGQGGGPPTRPASRSEFAEASRLSQTSGGAVLVAVDTEERATRTPTNATAAPLFPPLGRSPDHRQPSVAVGSLTPTTPVATPAAAKQTSPSLPAVRQPAEERKKTQPAPRRFATLSSRKAHQRTPLPVERGVGEHAAALLQHEILLTRRYEMEAERGNSREIDRACETLQQLFPLRRQLLEQDMLKSCATVKARTKSKTGASPSFSSSGAPTPQRQQQQVVEEQTASLSSPFPSPAATAGTPDAAVDRSYQPQSVLQRHRQLLYDEAVRLELTSRATARDAYLDVLTQLAQRHVSAISWSVVESMLAEAREQLRQEVSTTAAASSELVRGGSDGDSLPGASADRATAVAATAPPRDKIQHLIASHLGVLELSQWPVQEVLQHLAALYRVPLHLLHEGIAEQQRRFAHTYNYEERFRAVDRGIGGAGGGGVGADCVLRVTLHRCRRPPLAPSRESATATSSAPPSAENSGGATAAAAAAADALGVGRFDPQSEPLFYIRLRVGQQSISSSAVPLSSMAANSGGPASTARFTGDSLPYTSSSSSSSTTKVLSFMGQTLTLYLPTASAAARKRRSVSAVYGSRQHTRSTADGPTTAAAGEEEDGAVVAVVELMQNGVAAPLARGTVDLEAMGLHSCNEGGRLNAQAVQIPLRRKGYRTAELKATVELTP